MLYFHHFRVLPIPRAMSEILFEVEVPLSQLASSFYPHLREFLNECLALNIQTQMEVFLYFFTFSLQAGGIDRVIYSRRIATHTFGADCVNYIPMNYCQGSWKERFFFIDTKFLPGSRKKWSLWNGLYVEPPTLNERTREMIHLFSEVSCVVKCPSGVPYSLCQNPDFFYEGMITRSCG